jgi:mRNA turnover protein 4
MPKSKRDKVVSLTKVKKKSKSAKETLVESIREAVSVSKHVYLLEIENERTDLLQQVRAGLRPGMVICGKNKLMQLALGVTAQTECEDNIRVFAKRISGSCAILCTTMPLAKVQAAVAAIAPEVHARSGSEATQTVTLPAGTAALKSFPHSAEPHLRSLGLPTLLKDGVIHLLGNHTVCEKGEVLDTSKAQLLRQLHIPMVKFKVSVVARWSRPNEVEIYENA